LDLQRQQAALCTAGCGGSTETTTGEKPHPKPDFVLRDDQTHNKFSRRITPVVRVPSVSICSLAGNVEIAEARASVRA